VATQIECLADARIAIDRAHLLTLLAPGGWITLTTFAAMTESSVSKVVALNVLQYVSDMTIQLQGGADLSRVVPLTAFDAQARNLRLRMAQMRCTGN
jgi:hypothetical protein